MSFYQNKYKIIFRRYRLTMKIIKSYDYKRIKAEIKKGEVL